MRIQLRMIVILYFGLSALILLVGSSLLNSLDALGDASFRAGHYLLGPFILAAHALWPSGLQFHILFAYGIATAFLAPCVALARHRRRSVRVLAYLLGLIVWLGSGHVAILGAME